VNWKAAFVLAPIASLFISLGAARAADSFDDIAVRAKNALEGDALVDAQAAAQELIEIDRERYEGYLYLGIAYFRQQDLPSAETNLRSALSRAPADRKQDVQAALDLLENTQRARSEVAKAREAEAQGFFAKAAEGYERAWMYNKVDGALGLQAATLWNERLSDAARAAQVLRRMLAHDGTRNSNVGAAASQMLKSLQPKLDAVWNAAMASGFKAKMEDGDLNTALREFGRAQDAVPEKPEPYVEIAALHVRWGRWDKPGYARVALLGAASRGLTAAMLLEKAEEEFLPLVAPVAGRDSSFIQFIGETLGPQAVIDLKNAYQRKYQTLKAALSGQWKPISGNLGYCTVQRSTGEIVKTASGYITIEVLSDLGLRVNGSYACYDNPDRISLSLVFDSQLRSFGTTSYMGWRLPGESAPGSNVFLGLNKTHLEWAQRDSDLRKEPEVTLLRQNLPRDHQYKLVTFSRSGQEPE
jgi:tetratricopeptide (TPR) repeat protein